MQCFFHLDTHATATCRACSRALCAECTARFSVVRCEPCLVAQNRGVARQHWTTLIQTAALLAAGVAFYALVFPSEMQLGSQAPVFVAVFPSVFWGWKFLTERQQTTLLLPLPLWVVFLIVRFTAAAFIGLVVGPWRVVVAIREILIIRRTSRAIAAGTI